MEELKTIEEQPVDTTVMKDYYELMYHTACRFIEQKGHWDEFFDDYVEGKKYL